MGKIEFEKGQYIVYASDEKKAEIVLGDELGRVDRIIHQMSDLVTKNGNAWKNFQANTSEEKLIIHFNDETSLLYDKDATSNGRVRQQRIDEKHIKIEPNGDYSYELAYRYPEIDGYDADFRLAHEMGHLMLNPSNVAKHGYDKSTDTVQVSGLIRATKGRESDPKAIYGEKMQESALNLLAQLAIRGEHRADDIISGKIDLSEQNSYKKTDNLVKLLVMAMRNDFDKEISFERLVRQKIDSVIKYSDGTEEPANIFFYGMLNDSSIIEHEFDKYMGRGAWRELNFTFSQLNQTDITDEKFNTIYQAAQELIIEFANVRMEDKYKQFSSRDGEGNKPNIQNKKKMIQDFINMQMTTTVETKDEVQNQVLLSLKQKVAHFLKKHNLFMNFTFVENFIDKQLNIFPISEEKIGEKKTKLRNDFESWLSNNGEYKNIPTPQRMAAPKRAENMNAKIKNKLSGR